MHGTDNMHTKDVLKYFIEYGPSHVEWINDSSCNIVFEDIFTAKRALEGTSTLTPESNEHPNPWRKGQEYNKKSNSIMLRFATTEDIKPPDSDPKKSAFYYNYGYKEQQDQKKNRKRVHIVRRKNYDTQQQEPNEFGKKFSGSKRRRGNRNDMMDITEQRDAGNEDEEYGHRKKRQTRFRAPDKSSSSNQLQTSTFTLVPSNLDALLSNDWEPNVTGPGIIGLGDDILQAQSSTSLFNSVDTPNKS